MDAAASCNTHLRHWTPPARWSAESPADASVRRRGQTIRLRIASAAPADPQSPEVGEKIRRGDDDKSLAAWQRGNSRAALLSSAKLTATGRYAASPVRETAREVGVVVLSRLAASAKDVLDCGLLPPLVALRDADDDATSFSAAAGSSSPVVSGATATSA